MGIKIGAVPVTLPITYDQSVALPGTRSSETVVPPRHQKFESGRGVTVTLRSCAPPRAAQKPHAVGAETVIKYQGGGDCAALPQFPDAPP